MAKEFRNPYQMDLISAGKTKLYNRGAFWAFNVAKYRALLSNDPCIIKYWYRHEAPIFFPDVYNVLELQRSFYYGDEFVENAEEFFGIIPMVCESLAKMVCGGGYEFANGVSAKIKNRLQPILEDNEFDVSLLKASIIETCGIGDGAWHVHFDPEVSDLPIIELVPAERLFLKRKNNRIVEYGIKQRVYINGEDTDYELHTIYSMRRKKEKTESGAFRWRDDGVLQHFRIWGGGRYQDRNKELKKLVFQAYGIADEETVLPLADIPVIYLPNTLNNTRGAGAYGDGRPYGIVFGLEGVSAAIDEILSNCVDTVRKSFPFLLIDEQMIPSDIRGDKDKSAFSTRRHSFMLPKNAKDDKFPEESTISDDIDRNHSYVIERDDVIVGVFTFIIGDDPTYKRIEGSWKNNDKYGTIHRIASNGQEKGIFELCLKYCESKISNIRIDTHKDNKIMQHLIEKNGFEECGIIYVKDGSPRKAYQKFIN